MNVNLYAVESLAKQIATRQIGHRIQVPHVSFKFNTETDAFDKLLIIDTIENVLNNASSKNEVPAIIFEYNDVLSKLESARWIYHAEDVLNNTDKFLMNFFDSLQLEEDNWKAKTGGTSLRESVENTVVDSNFDYQADPTQIDLSQYDLSYSRELYRRASEKAISL